MPPDADEMVEPRPREDDPAVERLEAEARRLANEITQAEAAPPAWEEARAAGPWAIVEIMGHTVRAGSISDAVIAGTTMLRVQHPSVPDHAGAGPLTELYGSGSLFCVRPCSREEATRFAEARWRGQPRPVPVVAELAAVADAYVEDDDDLYEPEEPPGGW